MDAKKIKAVSERLVEMFIEDQASLKATAETGQYQKLRKQHATELKEIISEIGWPTINLVGEEASQAAWLIAQHSDHDISFQEEALKLIRSLPEGTIKRANIAYLEDRILVNNGKPQIYGTQNIRDGQGKIISHPIDKRSFVNKRRKMMGLEPLEEYLKSCQEMADEMLEAEKMAKVNS